LASKGGRLEVIVSRLAELLREDDDGMVYRTLWAVAELGPKAAGAKEAVVAVLEGPILAKGKWDLLDDVVAALEKMKVQDERAAALLRRAARHHFLITKDVYNPYPDERMKRLRAVSTLLSEGQHEAR
jgi:hypothetical protein